MEAFVIPRRQELRGGSQTAEQDSHQHSRKSFHSVEEARVTHNCRVSGSAGLTQQNHCTRVYFFCERNLHGFYWSNCIHFKSEHHQLGESHFQYCTTTRWSTVRHRAHHFHTGFARFCHVVCVFLTNAHVNVFEKPKGFVSSPALPAFACSPALLALF